ncbi:MAG: hypothetical protein H6662_14225 [Ardenticatenaceae bacterium]|nr:hypothetical protein [Anaerolineales bacterium]MCB8922740.1 hypothetical protein [Ardenticatenaceae bacterium]MCB9003555.1 hypothetical protein [Ardenticatenaceae bacterium]
MSRTVLSLLVLLVLLGVSSALAPAVLAEPQVEDGRETAVTVITQQESPPDEQATTDETSALPEGLSRIFASLGLYIVTMFTMAIGTEIVVDVFKLVVGLRSKPTAMETLNDYEKMLPGTLESLGVGAEARAHLEDQVSALRGVLQPVFQVETAVAALKQKDFDTALAAFNKQNPQVGAVEAARQVIKQGVETAVAQLNSATAFGNIIPDSLVAAINTEIDQLADQAANMTPNQLYQKSFTLLMGELAGPISQWAEVQFTQLRNLSYQQARTFYEQQLKPQINNAGLGESFQRTLTLQIEDYLENIRLSHEADKYLVAMNKMLLEVEKQRDELASIWRKILRGIGNWLDARMSRITIGRKKLDTTIDKPENAATKLLEIERRDKKESNDRIQQLRLVSVIVGILLAYALKIDSADLVADLLPPGANFLSAILIAPDDAFFVWLSGMFHMQLHALTAGIVLTGLAASAGSGFWHDQLSRLQSVQKGVESAYQALQPVVAQFQPPAKEKDSK